MKVFAYTMRLYRFDDATLMNHLNTRVKGVAKAEGHR